MLALKPLQTNLPPPPDSFAANSIARQHVSSVDFPTNLTAAAHAICCARQPATCSARLIPSTPRQLGASRSNLEYEQAWRISCPANFQYWNWKVFLPWTGQM